MALSGSVTTNAYTYQGISRSVTLSWTATQNIYTNSSTISWELRGDGSTAGSMYVSEIRITIDGVQAYYRDINAHTNCYYGTLLCSGTQTVYHAADGTKSLYIKVEAGIYAWAINCVGENTFTLDTIPRPSSISTGPLTLGSEGTLTINSYSPAFTHDVSYSFGSYSGVIATKTAASSVAWTPPLELANAIPNAVSGVGVLTIDTYNGATKLGTKTANFTAGVPASIVPTIGDFTASKVNNDVPAAWDIYVQGKSQCELKILNAAGVYSSTIESYSIKEGTTTISSSATDTTAILNTADTITYTAVVTDSRGRTASKTVSIVVEAYSSPTILSSLSQRCLPDGTLNEDGTYIKCLAAVELSALGGKNTATQKVYFKKPDDEYWSTGTDFISEAPVVIAGTAVTDYSYVVKYEVIDAFATVQMIDVIPTGYTTMDFRKGGRGIAFGKVSEKDAFECAMDAEFNGFFMVGGKSLLDWMHPVGSVYISGDPTNPAMLFGGVWERIKDKFILAAGDTYAAGSTGGEAEHTLTKDETANYMIGKIAVPVPGSHANWSNLGIVSTGLGNTAPNKPGVHNDGSLNITSGTQWGWEVWTNGGGNPHNNMPLYVTKYVWERIA